MEGLYILLGVILISQLATVYFSWKAYKAPVEVDFKARKEDLIPILNREEYKRHRVEHGAKLNTERFGKPKPPKFPENRIERHNGF